MLIRLDRRMPPIDIEVIRSKVTCVTFVIQYYLLQLLLSACVAAVKSRPVLGYIIV